ncbi:MAG TPA: hypothetical protein VIU87_07115, partial [Mycobacterium sp.]
MFAGEHVVAVGEFEDLGEGGGAVVEVFAQPGRGRAARPRPSRARRCVARLSSVGNAPMAHSPSGFLPES